MRLLTNPNYLLPSPTFHNGLGRGIVHLGLGHVGFQNLIEHVNLSLGGDEVRGKQKPRGGERRGAEGGFPLTAIDTHWSSEPGGNLQMILEPVASSVLFRGRNLNGCTVGVTGGHWRTLEDIKQL